ncbi:MAG: hypothetical protein H0S78_10625, partial [Tissierellales bacterium]|nr:hypothetical protein [Tissierellales bacterium]
MKKLSEMTPYQLGESNKKEAVEYLIKYFEKGKDKDIKLSVSAINKLSKKYPTETKKAISYIVDNLNNRESQIREIAMKTLSNFELDKEILDVIKKIKDEDEKEYNRKIANSILKKNQNKFKTDDLNITKENGNNTVDKKNNSDEQERIQDSILLKKQRSKPLYIKQTNGVDRYSANYSYTNHNFVIQNNKGSINKNNKYFPVICILKNILMRGCPTIMSDYLQKNIGMIHNREDFKKEYVLISNIEPEWYKTIKGDEFNNDYPAKVFFDEIIEEYLPDYKFIKQLILPEASFYDITLNLDKNYSYQKVDFYLPQANLVIEIDGQQHKNDDNT